MGRYKYANQENTWVVDTENNNNFSESHAAYWENLQSYLAAGGQVDPWKTTTELLEDARTEKQQEILVTYQLEEEKLEITAGAVYPANPQFISDLYVETQLANMNGETSVIVFDTSNNPHSISLGVVEPALQSMRALAKDLRIKGKAYLVAISEANTVEEVEEVIWE